MKLTDYQQMISKYETALIQPQEQGVEIQQVNTLIEIRNLESTA